MDQGHQRLSSRKLIVEVGELRSEPELAHCGAWHRWGEAAVLSESVLDQNDPKCSKRTFWSKWPYSELDFSIRETKMDQNGPFWSILAWRAPFRSANRTLAIPESQPQWLAILWSHGWNGKEFRQQEANLAIWNSYLSLPPKQKIGVQKNWARESEVGLGCRRFWAWILGVNVFLFGGGPETLEKHGQWMRRKNFAIKIRWETRRQFSKIRQAQ